MVSKSYRISVLIRTRDIERHLRGLLLRLSYQTLQPSELVIVNNFSSKSSLEEMINLLSLAKRRFFNDGIPVKIVPLTDEEFSYAYSANAGVFVAGCDLVCLTNGHCLPLSDGWLESGVAHFRCYEVAGVGAYTLPDRYGTTWERLAFDWRWRRLNEVSGFYAQDDFFSTVNCIIRKSLWEEYPFDERIREQIPHAGRFGGEDYDWGVEMFARGYRIVVEPRFDVYHSHGETISRLVPKYLVWRQIRKSIKSLKRPRESHTILRSKKPLYYSL